ncbi:uncharacterized protein [Littorina saxatilis]|uniref:uncharacterized protein n=1 Tax=Littorina saxatilis TaxID=31220 RepID=UPI0038B6AF77
MSDPVQEATGTAASDQEVIDALAPTPSPEERLGVTTRTMAKSDKEVKAQKLRDEYWKESQIFQLAISQADDYLQEQYLDKYKLRQKKKVLRTTYRELHALNDKLQAVEPSPKENEDEKSRQSQLQTIVAQVDLIFPRGPDSIASSASSVSTSASKGSTRSSQASSAAAKLARKIERMQLHVQLQSTVALEEEERVAKDIELKKSIIKKEAEERRLEEEREREERELKEEREREERKLTEEREQDERKYREEERKLKEERERDEKRLKEKREQDERRLREEERRLKEEAAIEREESEQRAKMEKMRLQFKIRENDAVISTIEEFEQESRDSQTKTLYPSLTERFISNAPPNFPSLIGSGPIPLMAMAGPGATADAAPVDLSQGQFQADMAGDLSAITVDQTALLLGHRPRSEAPRLQPAGMITTTDALPTTVAFSHTETGVPLTTTATSLATGRGGRTDVTGFGGPLSSASTPSRPSHLFQPSNSEACGGNETAAAAATTSQAVASAQPMNSETQCDHHQDAALPQSPSYPKKTLPPPPGLLRPEAYPFVPHVTHLNQLPTTVTSLEHPSQRENDSATHSASEQLQRSLTQTMADAISLNIGCRFKNQRYFRMI